MKWTTKSAVLRALDKIPGGDELHYLLQRRVTKSLPRPRARIPEYVANFRRHVGAFRAREIDFGKGLLMSFGAGWDLLENLVYYAYGVNRQVVFDIKPLARADLVDGLAASLALEPPEGSLRRPFPPLGANLKSALSSKYGIDYRAPGDARNTELPTQSVDMIATSDTLEHIPKQALIEIISECRRVIAPTGVASMSIDYSDHFSHFDASISPYNFLRFDSGEWRRHNMASHFQNRMRHRDYAELFRNAGFSVAGQEVVRPPNWPELLRRQPIATEFSGAEAEDLAIVRGYFILLPDNAYEYPPVAIGDKLRDQSCLRSPSFAAPSRAPVRQASQQ